jgi:large subunit ribosomal protein L1
MNKRIKQAAQLVDNQKLYPVSEAIEILKTQRSSKLGAKFDETIDIAFSLSIDPKKSEQAVKGDIILPHALGKIVRVVAIVDKQDDYDEAKRANADIIGGTELIHKIQNGFLDFDSCVCTPDMLSQITKISKILGPKGLMPTVKSGTVSSDIAKIIKELKQGRLRFRNDKSGIVHAGIAKISFDNKKIEENINCVFQAVIIAKPDKVKKKQYINKLFVSSTHGVSIQLDLTSF